VAKGSVSEEFIKHLSNFVRALIAIAPSRNYVTQFLYIVKMNGSVDYHLLEDAYPEIMKDDYIRDAFAKAFGVSFGEKVSLESGKYGYHLTRFIDEVFKLFESSEFRAKASALLKDEYPEGIPNLVEEWLEVRIRGALSDPNYGKNAIRILKEIAKVGRLKVEDIERRLGLGRGVIYQCLNLLDIYKLVRKEYDDNYVLCEELRRYPRVLEGIRV